MEESMMVTGKMIIGMEKESTSMLVDLFMSVTGKRIGCMEQE